MRDEKKIKSAGVKIINIIAVQDNNYIHGLGDDDRIYIWIASDHIWLLNG